MRKFSMLGRQKLESSLEDIFGNISTVQYCLSKLRPKVRTFLLRIAAGESVHPKIVRMQMGVFVKSAVLRAEVFSIPTKIKGLRMQSSLLFPYLVISDTEPDSGSAHDLHWIWPGPDVWAGSVPPPWPGSGPCHLSCQGLTWPGQIWPGSAIRYLVYIWFDSARCIMS